MYEENGEQSKINLEKTSTFGETPAMENLSSVSLERVIHGISFITAYVSAGVATVIGILLLEIFCSFSMEINVFVWLLEIVIGISSIFQTLPQMYITFKLRVRIIYLTLFK